MAVVTLEEAYANQEKKRERKEEEGNWGDGEEEVWSWKSKKMDAVMIVWAAAKGELTMFLYFLIVV